MDCNFSSHPGTLRVARGSPCAYFVRNHPARGYSLEFLDHDEELEPVDTDSQLSGDDRRRQFVVRRLVAISAGILILILVVFGVRGILDARKTRAFENYVNDLSALASQSDQLSQNFFARLDGAEQSSDLSFEAQVNTDKAAAETLVSRAVALDPPDELRASNGSVVLAFELRRDGLAEIAAQLPAASADQGANRANRRITNQMGVFFASDVLYARGRDDATIVLAEEAINREIPKSQFLPSPPPNWLDEATVTAALGNATGNLAPGVGGVHGLGLIATSLNGVPLSAGTETTVTVIEGTPELQVQVQNQGEADESDIGVSFTLNGINGEKKISTIAPQETQTVTIPINPAPPVGQPLTLQVSVDTVPGEQVADNNSAEYTVRIQ